VYLNLNHIQNFTENTRRLCQKENPRLKTLEFSLANTKRAKLNGVKPTIVFFKTAKHGPDHPCKRLGRQIMANHSNLFTKRRVADAVCQAWILLERNDNNQMSSRLE
jgi:hypothetical protein